jgi:hypothetical protein
MLGKHLLVTSIIVWKWQSCKYHGVPQLLQKCREENFARGRMNPTERTVGYWHDQRFFNLGPRNGTDLFCSETTNIHVYNHCFRQALNT